jgi:type I restriction enzyme R subunit
MLKASGWKVAPYADGKPLTAQDRYAIEEYPTAAGPADYALCVNGQIIGIVEAKKLTLGPQNVLSQAERYSKGLKQPGLSFGEYGVPFLYSTNGEVIWHHDIRYALNRSRQITRFHTPEALSEMLSRDFDEALRQLHALPNNNARLRPYQREANDAIEKAISERKRAMLVAMATGTGKTFTLVNEIYRLMKSGEIFGRSHRPRRFAPGHPSIDSWQGLLCCDLSAEPSLLADNCSVRVDKEKVIARLYEFRYRWLASDDICHIRVLGNV